MSPASLQPIQKARSQLGRLRGLRHRREASRTRVGGRPSGKRQATNRNLRVGGIAIEPNVLGFARIRVILLVRLLVILARLLVMLLVIL